MNEFYGFENLECWKQAKDLAVEIYRLQNEGNFSDDYGLFNDLRQSATSVASLIAGGRERGGASEFIRYLSKAKSTAALLRTQLVIGREIGYLAEGDYLDFEDKINRITAMVGGLIKAIRNKSRGSGADSGAISGVGSDKSPGSGKSAGLGARSEAISGVGSGTGSSKGSGRGFISETGSNTIKAQEDKGRSKGSKPVAKDDETKVPLQPDILP